MTRFIAMLVRGSSRVVLGISVALPVAWALLWLTGELFGTGILLWFSNVWLGFALALLPALAGGIAVAIGCDRVWMRVRGRGPKITLKRW